MTIALPTGTHPSLRHPLASLFTYNGARSQRWSSWDRTGANHDWVRIEAGQTFTLLEHDGPGCINHLYGAFIAPRPTDYRDAILRCYWDGESTPSVEVPLGDFFGIAHARVREYQSLLATVNPGAGSTHGLNAYFPMPFSTHALITLENRGSETLGGAFQALWYHIDFDTYDEPPPGDALRFHAQYRQERLTTPAMEPKNVSLHEGINIGGAENYVALEATGAGQMVGLVLEIDNVAGGWYGEGDDMVFIDGDTWPPAIHGTGTEEIFGGGASPNLEYAGPYTGFHQIERTDYGGCNAMYRWYVQDAIRFRESLRWTIEHGHANNFANEYSSVAYWYQTEPHAAFPELPGRDALLPRLGDEYEQASAAFFGALRNVLANRTRNGGPRAFTQILRLGDRFYAGDWRGTTTAINESGLAG